MEEEKRHAMFASFRARRSPKEVIEFFTTPSQPSTTSGRLGTLSKRMMLIAKSVLATRTDEFVAEVKRKVNEDGNKLYAKLAAEMGCSKQTIANTINKDLDYSSYKKRHLMILTEGTKESRVKAAALLNNLKPETAGLLRFFSDDNFFSQDQNRNRQNDRWICQNVDEVPVVKHTKFPSSVMVLWKGLKVNTAIYIDVMKNVVKPWMDLVANGRPYVFQQDSALAHKSRETQAWLLENLPYHWTPLTANPLDYFFWGMVEIKTNKHAHNTLDSLRAAIVEEFANMKKDVVAKACGRFRHRLEMVVAADGSYIEK
ncbi:Transposable element tcb1 transposase [Caligus rogercresseyi]|uniref:Transposable element tcb1 transposase n=1 Tax=Caligus rogercresseyi TaxID=217165 RepID=A0A7T8KG12_CALRO|nr:Transposable element tcb1 transposase [Caligus rogercresseyi]